MIRRVVLASSLAILSVLLAVCSELFPPPPTPTPVQTLAVTLWVEWPVAPYGYEQTIHVIVADAHDNRIRSATVTGQLVSLDGSTQTLLFPITDKEGYTSLAYALPLDGKARETFRVMLDVVFLSHYGAATTDYEVRPQ